MKSIFIALAAFTLLSSCGQEQKSGKKRDTAVSGSIVIAADESLKPIVDAEVSTFNGIYTKAHIDVIYMSEVEALKALLYDTIPVAVLTRRLTPEEKKVLAEKKLVGREEDVAISGIALITNKSEKDSTISITDLKNILEGKITHWNQIGSKSKAEIKVVFDHPTSGLIRYLKDSIANVEKLPSNCFAVDSSEAVIDYVARNSGTLGLIGLEWISDKDDTTSNNFLKRVRVMAVAGDSTHFEPYQAYVALKYYPLMRKITIINRQPYSGLGSGFASFFASPPGQRIVLKSGLVPATMPLRIVEVKRDDFEVEK
jgi:phosphate transport system substrate-binding protein